MANKYVVEEAELRCSAGSTPAKLIVTSQKSNKIEQKLQATENDKTLMGNFGACAFCNGNACAPALQQWKVISSKKTIKGQKLLLDDSFIQCAKGGVVNITDPNQSVARLGDADEELDKYYPKLQGDVVFVNGYHSDIVQNRAQNINAILDINYEKRPWHRLSFLLKGESVGESNHTNRRDIYTNKEVRKDISEDASEKEAIKALGEIKPLEKTSFFSFRSKLRKFWNYWNNEDNGYDASKLYCDYFNATSRDHYINGSHGLGSNAAHRIDHGIALGYKWAKENWRIYPKEAIPEERLADENDYIHTFTPPYKPITVVGHSHGAAMSTGVALGILYYACEIGWDKIALNVIYLASNQPQGLHDEEYYNLIDDKVKFYEVNITQVNLRGKQNKRRLVNKLSEIFSLKHNKLYHNRGINEHLEAILEDQIETYRNRCVQFTFTNDRGDMVIRDGDIPKIKSACDPETNTDAFHCHFVGKDLKAKSDNDNPKMNCKELLQEESYVKYYNYFVNRRFFTEKKKRKERINKNEIEFKIEEWVDSSYLNLLKDCMESFRLFKERKKWFGQQHGTFIFRRELVLVPDEPITKELFDSNILAAYYDVHNHYVKYIKAYALLFQAQLYAHFAPVSWINNKKILSDFPDDDYGKISIFDRICKAGKDIFYRIEVKNNPDGTPNTEEDKRQEFKIQFKKMQKRLISTEVGNTEYIKNVIQAYVYNDKEALKKLYKEPNHKKIKPYVDGIYGDQL